MKIRLSVYGSAFALLIVLVGPIRAEACVADCDMDGEVQVNNLIVCVNIAQENFGVDACAACDPNRDGSTAINELVTGVANLLGDRCGVCGNGVVEGDELCDDGNAWGGDGCAENCTTEDGRLCEFAAGTGVLVQLAPFVSPQALRGAATVTTGTARASAGNGELPLVIRAEDVDIEPTRIPGFACVCQRAGELEEFGPGNNARGVIGCGDGLADVDYFESVDHNTTDVDPNCATGLLEDGSPAHPHAGACNGPRTRTVSGRGPAGSFVYDAYGAVSVIVDGGTCLTDPSNPAKGPDGIPCTEDDPNQAAPIRVRFTSGTAEAEVLDADNVLGVRIGAGEQCGAEPCQTARTGRPFDCAALAANPTGGLDTGEFVQAVAALDPFGDLVATRVDLCEPPPAPPTPIPEGDLGPRTFSLNSESSGHVFVRAGDPEPIFVPGFAGFLELYAGPLDPNGVAEIKITDASEFISGVIPGKFGLRAGVTCVRPDRTRFPVENAGVLFCNGGFTIGICSDRDHNIGVVDTCTAPAGPGAGLPEGTPCTSDPECASGQCFSAADCLATSCVFPLEPPRVEGPDERHPGVCIGPHCGIIPIVEVGGGGPATTDEVRCPREPDAGPGSVFILEDPQFGNLGLWGELTVEEALPCGDEPEADFIGIFNFPLTTATAAGTIFNANNEPGVTLEDSVTGENFSCDQWTEEDGPGTLVITQLVVGFPFLPEDSVVSWVFDD